MASPLSEFAKSSYPKAPGCWVWCVAAAGLFFLVLGIGVSDWIPLTLGIFGVGVSALFLLSYWSSRKSANEKNEVDHNAAQEFDRALKQVSAQSPSIVDDSTPGMRVLSEYSLGEVARHFDSDTHAKITGGLEHRFGLVGWGVGVSIGSVGVGTGQIGIQGKSDVHLDLSGTARDNLIGDGFVAVLEKDQSSGERDIIRVVGLSDPATREYVSSMLLSLGRGFGQESHRDNVFRRNVPGIQSSFHNDAAHVSDRLSSIMRMELSGRPTITVVGIELTEHAILGGAIRFGNDKRWYQLFPLCLIQKISEFPSVNMAREAYLTTLADSRPVDDSEIIELLRRGQKIDAIKRYRDRTGSGLKKSKDYVEGIERNMKR
jgi:hypothetical protein